LASKTPALAFESTALLQRTPALAFCPPGLPIDCAVLTARTAARVFHPSGEPEKTGNIPSVSLLYLAKTPGDGKNETTDGKGGIQRQDAKPTGRKVPE
jgi:hypothetical protein